MPLDETLRRLSLKTRLIVSYLVILAVGGLVTSIVGSWIVSTTIMRQAQRTAEHDLATARIIFQDRMAGIGRTVQLAATATGVVACAARGECASAGTYLAGVRGEMALDFLTIADANGVARLRTTPMPGVGDTVAGLPLVPDALAGDFVASSEILTVGQLEREAPTLVEQVRLRIVETPRASPGRDTVLSSGLVMLAAGPILDGGGLVVGALYGGVLVNGREEMVDRVWELLYRGETHRGRQIGTVTVFQGDVRIATNVRTVDGARALGTRVSAPVHDAVLLRGERWSDRAFVVQDWYLSVYEPLRNHRSDIIGMLYVGVLESRFTAIRNRVILSFFGIASTGFILIIAITYVMIRNITRPIGEMVAATRNISAGKLDQEIQATAQGEVALLAESFNTMAKSLRHMKDDLEEWGRTLEEKVRERTDELVRMQARVAQSERLASLGMLAAGVAHEINNPLGGILALTALTVEDLPDEHPNRPNLEEVVRQAERCRAIVRGLLEFSRQSELHMEVVDLNRLLDDTLALVAKQAAFFNVEMVRHHADDLPPIAGDRSQLAQVILNLVVNAVQAMEERGTLTITTRFDSANDAVEMAFTDTGRGIAPGDLGRVFDPFFTTKTDGQGTGLGLSIAYGIVTRHHGTITVESEVGRGTTFRIRLPVGGAVPEPVSP
jgi:two-component system NtrC family sensor kinase